MKMAMEHGIRMVAHPGFPDLMGFGRRKMILTPREAADYVLYQVGALDAFIRSRGGQMQHVKPHGALYNMVTDPKECCSRVVQMVRKGLTAAVDGGIVKMRADSVCLHGDGEQALEFASILRAFLEKSGVKVQALTE